MNSNKNKKLQVSCPVCKKKFNYFSAHSRPFCSERCQQIDLGRWASGEYIVASSEPLSEEDIEEVIRVHSEESGEDL